MTRICPNETARKIYNAAFSVSTSRTAIPQFMLANLPDPIPQTPYAAELGPGLSDSVRHLLQRGYIVDAVDLSDAALANLEANHRRDVRDGRLRLHNISAADYVPQDPLSLVFSKDCLHHLPSDKALEFLVRMQQHTVPGGTHILRFGVEDYRGRKIVGDLLTLSRMYGDWTQIMLEPHDAREEGGFLYAQIVERKRINIGFQKSS